MDLDASGTGLPNSLPEAMWNLVHRVPNHLAQRPPHRMLAQPRNALDG